MPRYTGPVITRELAETLRVAHQAGSTQLTTSFDLGRSQDLVQLGHAGWTWRGQCYPWPGKLKDRSLYICADGEYLALQRYAGKLIKLVPTEWGAPTFEIDGIKMLPTAQLSPFTDAQRKVALIQPQGKQVLDTCGGLGYFAACCLAGGAARVQSYEKNPDVLWLREHNPWSPDPDSSECAGRLQLTHADVSEAIRGLAGQSVDAILHDPPRFGIAGELYSQDFYDQLARVLKPQGLLFHYTGSPNAKTSGRDVPGEVAKRLTRAGFSAERILDGILARRAGRPRSRSTDTHR